MEVCTRNSPEFDVDRCYTEYLVPWVKFATYEVIESFFIIMLASGLHKGRSWLVLPFLVFQGVSIVVLTIMVFSTMVELGLNGILVYCFDLPVLGWVILFFKTCLLINVGNYYNEIKRMKNVRLLM